MWLLLNLTRNLISIISALVVSVLSCVFKNKTIEAVRENEERVMRGNKARNMYLLKGQI